MMLGAIYTEADMQLLTFIVPGLNYALFSSLFFNVGKQTGQFI